MVSTKSCVVSVGIHEFDRNVRPRVLRKNCVSRGSDRRRVVEAGYFLSNARHWIPVHQVSDISNFITASRHSNPWERLRWLGLFVLTTSLLLVLLVVLTPSSKITRSSLAELSYLEDPDGTLTLSEIEAFEDQFTAAESDTLNFGLSASTHWVWIKLNRPFRSSSSKLYVELGYPHLDVLQTYQKVNDRFELQYSLGDFVSFNNRPVKDRTWVIPVDFTLQDASVDLLVRTQSKGSVQLPLVIHTEESYRLVDRNEQLVLGLYYGILFGLLAYNILLALGTREKLYVEYCAYAVFQGVFQFSQNGLAFEYFWPEATGWHQVSIPFFACLSLLFCLRFTRVFLNVDREHYSKLHIAFRIAEGVFLFLTIASFYFDKSLVIMFVSITVTLAGIFMLGVASYIYLKGDPNARLYLLAWGVLLFGIIVYAAKTLGFLPELFITEYSVQIGSVIEMVLLSYALADRFNRLKNENIKVQEEASATLENRVALRTQELADTLVMLENANARLEASVLRDPLTNIYNRRHFNLVLDEKLGEAKASQTPLSVLMIDIDHFKKINDTYGHLMGDDVIISVAKMLDVFCVDSLFVPARFGGEEFVVLLPEFSQHEAYQVAEKIRLSVQALGFNENMGSEPLNVTVSIGVSSIEDKNFRDTALKLIDRADQALYSAKASGRNRSHLYQSNDSGAGPGDTWAA